MTGQTPPAETPEIPRHSRDSAGWLMKSILLHMRMEMDKRMESVGLTDAPVSYTHLTLPTSDLV